MENIYFCDYWHVTISLCLWLKRSTSQKYIYIHKLLCCWIQMYFCEHKRTLQPCPIFILFAFLCISFTFSSWPNLLKHTIGQASFFTGAHLNQWTGTHNVGQMFFLCSFSVLLPFHRCPSLDKRAFQLQGWTWNTRNCIHYAKEKYLYFTW